MIIDNELVVLTFRGSDRLLISIGGIISIWLGYKLFNKALPDNGSFDGGVGSWSVRMHNIAPGVFFALFGASVLIFSITHPLFYKSDSGSVVFSGIAEDAASELDIKRTVDILNALSVVNIYKNKKEDSLTPEQINKVNDSYAKLFAFQISLINKSFGAGSFDKYQEISSDIRRNPDGLKNYSKEDQALYQGIKSIFAQ